MTWIPFILLAIGLLLIYLEFFLPGGILGIAGSLLIVASIIVFAMKATAAWSVIVYIIGVGVIVVFMIRWALWRIKKGKTPGIFLTTVQEGYVASKFDETLVGKEGEAISDLKPSGHVLVEGKRCQAVSKIGYVVKGTKIEVIGGEGAHLIVKAIDKEM